MNQTFPKSDRLNSRKEIEQLFSDGKSMLVYPFKVFWTERNSSDNNSSPLKVAFSVPKRKFKKAPDRNLIKRRSREAYRKNNRELKKILAEKNTSMNLMLVYIANNKLAYEEIQLKIILVLQRLAKTNG